MRIFISIFVVLLPFHFLTQNKIYDSLIPIINNSPEDSNKVMALNYLSTELVEINLDTSIILSNQSLSIAKKKLTGKKG